MLPRWKARIFSAAVVAVVLTGVAACVLILEIGLRLHRGSLFPAGKTARNALDVPASDVTKRPIAIYDPLLGHIPAPNLRGLKSYEATVTTDGASIRRNGSEPRPTDSAVLAIGDSFTFGLEVNDNESWPAQLEGHLSRPVINAGVFGYGVDQIVLRGEQVAATRKEVDLVILAVFGEDIERCEFSYLYATKPYFTIQGGRLELQNVPVPAEFSHVRLASVRQALKHSQLADVLLTRIVPSWWLIPGRERREHHRGDEVAALLLERWSQFARQRNLRTLYVALLAWPGDAARLRVLTSHARRVGLDVLDLSGPLLGMLHADRRKYSAAAGHLTREGNQWVAAQIADHLRLSPTSRTN